MYCWSTGALCEAVRPIVDGLGTFTDRWRKSTFASRSQIATPLLAYPSQSPLGNSLLGKGECAQTPICATKHDHAGNIGAKVFFAAVLQNPRYRPNLPHNRPCQSCATGLSAADKSAVWGGHMGQTSPTVHRLAHPRCTPRQGENRKKGNEHGSSRVLHAPIA